MRFSKLACCLAITASAGIADAAGFNSQSYVQDGLIAQFDAIDNVGTGAHDATATVWKDLKGSASVTLPSGVKWGDRALDAARVKMTAKNMPAFYLDSVATEVVMDNLGHRNDAGYPRPFYHPKSDGWYTVYFSPGHNTPQYYLGNDSNHRPGFGNFLWGTLGMASDTTNFRTYNNGVFQTSSGSVAMSHQAADAADWSVNLQYGWLEARYRSLRHYNRALTAAEFAQNAKVDMIRFYSFQLTGSADGDATPWATAAWVAPRARTDARPLTDATDYARIIGAKVAATAADGVNLKCLSLEDGAKLVLGAGDEVCAVLLCVEGQTLSRGVYTGPDGSCGTKVDWIEGTGQLRVAGEGATRYPRATRGFSAHSYVQDGLVTQFDAIENVTAGQAHDAAAAKWLDLAGTASLTLTTNVTWREGRYFEKDGDGTAIYFGQMPAYKRNSMTCDVPVNIHENGASSGGGYPRLFSNYEKFSIYFNGADTEGQVYICDQKPDARPTIGKFRIGTAAAFSGPSNYGGAVDGVVKSRTSNPVKVDISVGASTWSLGYAGMMRATYGGLRFYNRCLTESELKQNALVDKFRYFSYRYMNTNDEAIAWADIPWSVPEGQTAAAPGALTNQYVTIVGGTTTVAATDEIALLGLSLENGAKLKVAEGASVSVKLLYVNGQAIDHCIYTGEGGTVGDVADWIEGGGQVRVAGATDREIPHIVPTPDSDGWYTFGLANGSTSEQRTFVGERVVWDAFWFPEGVKKLRLTGYVLTDTVPDIFADYDTTGLKVVYVNGTRAYAADRPFEVPANATFRFLPAKWTTVSENTHTCDLGNSTAMAQTTGEITLGTGSRFAVTGDGLPNLTFGGNISGDGDLHCANFGRQMRLTGGVALTGSGTTSWQCGSGAWFDTVAQTSSLQTVWLSNCDYQSGTNEWYCASYLAFGRNGSDATADHPLSVATLWGNAYTMLDQPSGHIWRSGGHLLVWGSNTVHIGTLNRGLHVIASQKDQDCKNGFLSAGTYTAKGIGFVEIGTLASGTVFGSTNVALTVGTVAAKAGFDYTCQANGVNRLTLDITGTCAESATLKATDLAMLPARVSGFKGQVSLTDTAAKNYEMPIDLTAGPQGLYNPLGCNGSGTLVAAPQTSSINVTFPTEGIEPLPGKYAIARFTSGGELLNGWTVTLNGEAVTETRIGSHYVTLRRNAKGITLGVDLPGFGVILR